MICPDCGCEIPGRSKFCIKCGVQLSEQVTREPENMPEDIIGNGYKLLSNGEFLSAKEFFLKVLQNYPNNSAANIGLLLVELEYTDVSQLTDTPRPLNTYMLFTQAVEWSNPVQKAQYIELLQNSRCNVLQQEHLKLLAQGGAEKTQESEQTLSDRWPVIVLVLAVIVLLLVYMSMPGLTAAGQTPVVATPSEFDWIESKWDVTMSSCLDESGVPDITYGQCEIAITGVQNKITNASITSTEGTLDSGILKLSGDVAYVGIPLGGMYGYITKEASTGGFTIDVATMVSGEEELDLADYGFYTTIKFLPAGHSTGIFTSNQTSTSQPPATKSSDRDGSAPEFLIDYIGMTREELCEIFPEASYSWEEDSGYEGEFGVNIDSYECPYTFGVSDGVVWGVSVNTEDLYMLNTASLGPHYNLSEDVDEYITLSGTTTVEYLIEKVRNHPAISRSQVDGGDNGVHYIFSEYTNGVLVYYRSFEGAYDEMFIRANVFVS